MRRFVIDVSLLDELAAEMAGYDDMLGIRCAALADRLHRLHADSRGTAATDLGVAQAQLTSATDEMRSALLRLGAAAETAAANYRAATVANVDIWTR